MLLLRAIFLPIIDDSMINFDGSKKVDIDYFFLFRECGGGRGNERIEGSIPGLTFAGKRLSILLSYAYGEREALKGR